MIKIMFSFFVFSEADSIKEGKMIIIVELLTYRMLVVSRMDSLPFETF